MYVQKVMGEEDTPSPDRTMEPYLSCLNLFFSPERVEEFFLSESENKCFLSVVAKFISWGYKIKEDVFELLVPFMLAFPYG